jgi:hypothetical protein
MQKQMLVRALLHCWQNYHSKFKNCHVTLRPDSLLESPSTAPTGIA